MVQPNSQYGNSIYFPYAAGSLIAYAFKDERIKSEYDFKGFYYKRSDIDEAVKSLDNPYLIGFSCYIWNYEYNKVFAKAVKKLFPECIIVFGGHQLNAESEVINADYVDYCLLSEGEESFKQLLLSLVGEGSTKNIPNLIYKSGDSIVKTQEINPEIPDRVSPYLEGYFDEMIENEQLAFSAILETNRGCPNKCAFCDWGNIKAKIKNYDIELIKAEIRWMSEKKIEYCYCADANFGLFSRDIEIIEYMIEKHLETGYPEKFQATYSKNNPDTVFHINKRLNDVGMSKGATLSFQSMHQNVLDNIYRKNMPLESFHKLMTLYNTNGIGAYSEIILGLPGETYDSFKDGIEQLLERGQHMSINFFNCELLKNAIMNDADYKKKYEIDYAQTELHQYHTVPSEKDITELSRIIVSTSTMTKEDWISCNILSVFVRAFHNLGLLQCVAIYNYYENKIKYTSFYSDLIQWAKNNPETICGKLYLWLESKYRQVLNNSGSLTCVDEAYGALTWPLDEGIFLKIVKEYFEFFEEITPFLKKYFPDEAVFDELIEYQKYVVKNPYSKEKKLELNYDFYSYFSGVYADGYRPIEKLRNTILIDSSNIPQTLPEYGKQVVWYGRKGGQNIITNITYLEK